MFKASMRTISWNPYLAGKNRHTEIIKIYLEKEIECTENSIGRWANNWAWEDEEKSLRIKHANADVIDSSDYGYDGWQIEMNNPTPKHSWKLIQSRLMY